MKSIWIFTAMLMMLSACSTQPARLGHETTTSTSTTHQTPLLAPE